MSYADKAAEIGTAQSWHPNGHYASIMKIWLFLFEFYLKVFEATVHKSSFKW